MPGKRVTGSVTEFMKQRGFGYIEVDNKKGDESDKVFVHWKEIKTDDRWPALAPGMKVEFQIDNDTKGGKSRFRATNVTAPGGGKIVCDDSASSQKIAGKHNGTVKFFNVRKGFGFIEISGKIPGVQLGNKNQINVARSEIVTDDEPPCLKIGSRVRFEVFKTDKGYTARNVTGPRGEKIHVPQSDRQQMTPRGQIMDRGMGGGPGGWGGQGGRGGFDGPPPRKRAWGQSNGGMDRRGGPSGRGRGGWSNGGGRGGGNWNQRGGGDFKRPRIGGPGLHAPGSMYGNVAPISTSIEVGLCIKKYYVGGLIGKKGVTIREMKKESGSVLQFGDEDIMFDGDPHRVMALSGETEQVTSACRLVATKIGEQAQSLDHKIIFLVPEEYCGMLIGKKGSNIQKIAKAGGDDRCVRVNVSQEATQLPGANRVNMCTLFGGQKNVANAIKTTVEILGSISQRIQRSEADQQMQSQPPPMAFGGGGWEQRQGPPRDLWASEGRGGGGRSWGGGGGWRR